MIDKCPNVFDILSSLANVGILYFAWHTIRNRRKDIFIDEVSKIECIELLKIKDLFLEVYLSGEPIEEFINRYGAQRLCNVQEEHINSDISKFVGAVRNVILTYGIYESINLPKEFEKKIIENFIDILRPHYADSFDTMSLYYLSTQDINNIRSSSLSIAKGIQLILKEITFKEK